MKNQMIIASLPAQLNARSCRSCKWSDWLPVYLLVIAMHLYPVQAANITVTTSNDEFGTGPLCSLREAVQAANSDLAFSGCSAGSGADTILLAADVYKLTLPGANEDNDASGDLDIKSDITIIGISASQTIIQSGLSATSGIDRVIHIVTNATVSIHSVIIRLDSVTLCIITT